jgi:branched-chain amino acid aminotransferase
MKLQKTESIWFNGELVPWDEARVHVLSHALHYASSVFEGIRAYATPRGPAVLRLREHVERLLNSARIVRLPITYTADELCEAVLTTVRASGLESCYIRPVAFRGYGSMGIDPTDCPVEVAIAVWPHGAHFGLEKRERGIALGVSSWRRMAPGTLPAMAKSSANYLGSQLVKLEAREHGYDDGIALDVSGYVAETSGANLFVVLGGRLHTAPLVSSILAGITRDCVVQLAAELGIDVVEERLPREMLLLADEVFVTGTAAEITPVGAIDGISVGTGRRGPLTQRLQERFLELVSGGAEDVYGWLTPVAGA